MGNKDGGMSGWRTFTTLRTNESIVGWASMKLVGVRVAAAHCFYDDDRAQLLPAEQYMAGFAKTNINANVAEPGSQFRAVRHWFKWLSDSEATYSIRVKKLCLRACVCACLSGRLLLNG